MNEKNINPAEVWSLGLLQMDFFYREKPWYAGQFVRKVISKINIPKKCILFFSVLLNSKKGELLSVLVRDVDKTFKDQKISLPTKNGKIDFAFMESFIAELEAERIAELEAYLSAAGLKNYELTPTEEQAVRDFEAGNIEWGEYNLKNLFGNATRGKRLKSDDRVQGGLPFVTAGESNTGISGFIGNDVDIYQKNTITVDMFGSAKYRNYDYGGDDHIAVIHSEKLPPKSAMFVTSAVHKSSYTGEFHYGRNFYAKDADNLNIKLPLENGRPDYEYMEILISAIQKLVIKEVVLYADRKIAATKEAAESR